MSCFETFKTWDDVLVAAKTGVRLHYKAPLDLLPCSLIVVRVFKNGKVRVLPLSNQVDAFTADASHLSRFLMMVTS